MHAVSGTVAKRQLRVGLSFSGPSRAVPESGRIMSRKSYSGGEVAPDPSAELPRLGLARSQSLGRSLRDPQPSASHGNNNSTVAAPGMSRLSLATGPDATSAASALARKSGTHVWGAESQGPQEVGDRLLCLH